MNENVLSPIRPHMRSRVMDLVEEAGIDVSDWSNYKGAHASANPRYCYEWAFVDPGKVVVLNLWFDSMVVDSSGAIVQRLNLWKWAKELERSGRRSVWARRARSLDQALQDAVRLKLPVRVIVNDGRQEDITRAPTKASSVERRMLDPSRWSVANYDFNTGECLLVRGVGASAYVDQFSLTDADHFPEKVPHVGEVFVRRREVRATVLARAGGRCELCGEPGFLTAGGRIYLETHHVVPLSERGSDSSNNVVALCPNDHRQAHYGIDCDGMRAALLSKLFR